MGSNKSFPNVPWLFVGYGKTFTTAGVINEDLSGRLVRFHAVKTANMDDVTFRLSSQAASVIVLSSGETDYFFVPPGEKIHLLSGSLNLMW